VADDEDYNTGQAWTFTPYSLSFRGVQDVPECFQKNARWREYHGTTGYYAKSRLITGSPVPVEFNHERLCWVELRYNRQTQWWDAFRIAAEDLGLRIRESELL